MPITRVTGTRAVLCHCNGESSLTTSHLGPIQQSCTLRRQLTPGFYIDFNVETIWWWMVGIKNLKWNTSRCRYWVYVYCDKSQLSLRSRGVNVILWKISQYLEKAPTLLLVESPYYQFHNYKLALFGTSPDYCENIREISLTALLRTPPSLLLSAAESAGALGRRLASDKWRGANYSKHSKHFTSSFHFRKNE